MSGETLAPREGQRAIWWAAIATWAHAALHIAVPPMMRRDAQWFGEALLRASLAYHFVLAVLFALLAAFMVRRQNWARVLLTVVLVLGAMGTAFSFSSPTPHPLLYRASTSSHGSWPRRRWH